MWRARLNAARTPRVRRLSGRQSPNPVVTPPGPPCRISEPVLRTTGIGPRRPSSRPGRIPTVVQLPPSRCRAEGIETRLTIGTRSSNPRPSRAGSECPRRAFLALPASSASRRSGGAVFRLCQRYRPPRGQIGFTPSTPHGVCGPHSAASRLAVAGPRRLGLQPNQSRDAKPDQADRDPIKPSRKCVPQRHVPSPSTVPKRIEPEKPVIWLDRSFRREKCKDIAADERSWIRWGTRQRRWTGNHSERSERRPLRPSRSASAVPLDGWPGRMAESRGPRCLRLQCAAGCDAQTCRTGRRPVRRLHRYSKGSRGGTRGVQNVDFIVKPLTLIGVLTNAADATGIVNLGSS